MNGMKGRLGPGQQARQIDQRRPLQMRRPKGRIMGGSVSQISLPHRETHLPQSGHPPGRGDHLMPRGAQAKGQMAADKPIRPEDQNLHKTRPAMARNRATSAPYIPPATVVTSLPSRAGASRRPPLTCQPCDACSCASAFRAGF